MTQIDYEKIILESESVLFEKTLTDMYGGDAGTWNYYLVKFKKEGFLNPVFRLNSNYIYEDYENEWVGYFGELAKNFKIKNSKDEIDGSVFNNLEVGFIKNSN